MIRQDISYPFISLSLQTFLYYAVCENSTVFENNAICAICNTVCDIRAVLENNTVCEYSAEYEINSLTGTFCENSVVCEINALCETDSL